MKNILGMKMIVAAVAGLVAVSSVGTGGYFMYDYEARPDEMGTARVVAAEALEEEEPEEEEIEEDILEEEESEEETEGPKELTLVGASIDKDLKIKIQDQNSKLVAGEAFSVSVKSEKKGAKAAEYVDKDKDGIIYINKIEAGNYTVAFQNAGEYAVKTDSISVAVKGQIEYKKVDVTAEIKKESQINTAAEDTAINNVPVESALKDTVAWVESSQKTSKVAKKDVDTSSFPKASAGSKMNTVAFKKVVTVVPPVQPEEPEKPTEPGNTDQPENPDTPEKPDGTENPDNQNPDSTATPASVPTVASVEAQSMETRAAANPPAETKEVKAEASLPAEVTLYQTNMESANTYKVPLTISGDNSIVKEVKWSSSDTNIAALSGESAGSVTVTAKAKGTATITASISYTATEDGSSETATLTSKVSVGDFADSSTVLKDKSGNKLYTDSSAKTTATVKDYASLDTFYTSPQYTGWQTIDGKLYYYTENHKPVTGNQVIKGVMYTFADDGSVSKSSGNRGIDVSKYQGNIDWGAVAASGVNFAIIRAGYRGSSTGVLVEDPYFKKNIAGATKAGIKVGIYFFTQAVTEAEAVEEASMAMSLASKYKLTYPIFIDTENAAGNARANGLSKSARTAIVQAFCKTVQNGGYKAGVYASKSWYQNQLSASQLNGYCIWVAQYNSSCTYSGKYDLWQYTSSGSVPGIKGRVDMNTSYTGY